MAVFTENSTHYYTYAFKILQLAILSIVFSILLSAANAQTVLIEDSVAYWSKKEVSILLAGKPAYDLIKFDKLPGNRIKFGFSGNELCFALLKLKAAKKIPFQLLSIDNTSLDCLVVYRIQFAKPIIKLYEGGRLIRYDHKREFVWHVIPMDIDSTPAYYLIAVKEQKK